MHISRHTLKSLMLFAAFGIAGLLLMAEPAHAGSPAGQSPMGNVICMIIGIIYGNLGRGLAIMAVLILGIGATIGKVSWGLAITVAIGIATIFGAVPLTAFLISGSAGTAMCYGAGGIL